jgi:ABC-type glycerol-3-phosphate transport system permease component
MQKFSRSDKLFNKVCFVYLFLAGAAVAYPLIYIVACSFSDPAAVLTGKVFLWPVNISLTSYKAVLNYPLLKSGFLNSLFYVAGGTTFAVALTLLAAYPLSRRDLPDRRIMLLFCLVTMFFSGGLIPGYLLMRNLHLIGSRWSLIVGFMFSCYNMIIVKSYFQTNIPQGLLDAAHIDGCGDVRFFFSFAIPLATPVIAVMVLTNAVGIWNSYFNGMLYLTKPETYNFQMVLRAIMFVSQMPQEMRGQMDPRELARMYELMQQMKYAIIVVGAVPMMVLYPFIQKYFIRGMTIGSLKE